MSSLKPILTEPLRARTWKATAYSLVSLPLGIFWFTVLVALLFVGAGMLITLVGIPILAAALVLAGVGARAERARARLLLGVRVPQPAAGLSAPGRPWWRSLFAPLVQPAAWRETLYLLLLLPIGIFLFTVAVTLWSTAAYGLSAPIWYWFIPASERREFLWEGNRLDSAGEWVGLVGVGAAALLAAPWILRGLLSLHTALMRALLGPTRGELQRASARAAEQRDRAVAAAAGERRQIERDLHDGAQARLVALAVDLGRARTRLEEGGSTEEAAALVRSAHEDTKLALAEIRDLARGIHPAILTDRGLDAALSSLAARCPVPVALSSEIGLQAPAPVESAAYFVVAEALTNVARHSGAHHAAVSVAREDGALVVEVRDDGVGGADPSGLGLAGLRDRVGALGGTLLVDSPEGGPTVIRAVLPCE